MIAEKTKSKKEEFNRSPFFYVGDKYKLLSQIKVCFPNEIDRFIEPFCGGGSVFLNVDAKEYLLNDIDSYMIKLHRFLLSSSHNTKQFWQNLQSEIEKYNLSATYIGRDVPSELRKEFVKSLCLILII